MAKRTKKKLKVKPKEKRFQSPVTAVHILGIVGGIIIILAGILWMVGNLLSWDLAAFSWFTFGDLGIINIVCGLVILLVSATLKKNFLAAGLVLLIFSIIAIIAPPAGFVVGPVLAIIGALIALVKAER